MRLTLLAVPVTLALLATAAPATAAPDPAPLAGATATVDLTAASDVARLVVSSRALAPQDADARVTFIVGLPRRSDRLAEAAQAVATPGKIEYRDVPTLTDAARTYGASSRQVRALRSAARGAGVDVSVDPSRLIARLTAPAGVWQDLYDRPVRVVEPTAGSPYREYLVVQGGRLAGAPPLFADVTSGWVAIAAEYVPAADTPGIDPALEAELASALAFPGSPTAFPLNTGTPIGDTCGQAALADRAVYAPAQLQRAYGTSGLARRGMTGEGTRLTIISLGGGFDQSDLNAAARCFDFPRPKVDIVLGTGVPESFRNASVETHLDLITAAAVLPQAESLRLVQAVDPMVGVTDALARSLDVDGSGELPPDVVSMSYGICEVEFVEQYAGLLEVNEDLLRMAALLGISVVVASGDHGTSMCGATASLEADGPLVSYPASSPWVTAVGGTRLTLGSKNARTREVVWNDLPFTSVPGAPEPGPAGSGGPSAVFDRPWYQIGMTPAGPRSLPDVSLLGAIKPGWPIFYGGTLYTVGGTSGGTPFFGANLALMGAQQRDTGYPPIGLVNPWLYSVAAKDGAPFYDVTRGNNAVQQVGCCTAYAGYDMASGLGVPVMNRLWRSLPLPAG